MFKFIQRRRSFNKIVKMFDEGADFDSTTGSLSLSGFPVKTELRSVTGRVADLKFYIDGWSQDDIRLRLQNSSLRLFQYLLFAYLLMQAILQFDWFKETMTSAVVNCVNLILVVIIIITTVIMEQTRLRYSRALRTLESMAEYERLQRIRRTT